ncbi:MAG: glucose-6-phosphate dehydrogenase [Anaerolineales bacterium]|nr:glucose-6-phosphate dehydrogenase [Anaerolineales bacterium]
MKPIPSAIVIFGGSSDLNKRKLMPALFNLHLKGRLPEQLKIIGYSRRPWSDVEFQDIMREAVQTHLPSGFSEEAWKHFAMRLYFSSGTFDEGEGFAALKRRLGEIETFPGGRLFYLAAPPKFFAPIVSHLGALDMVSENDAWRRVVVEKPFGHDLKSAQALNASLHNHLQENQIYRIDHYLGKETVQNLLVFRFANTIFEPLWNRNYINHVQITVAETDGVEHRAGYYDQVGVLRDMFQNHLLQLLMLVAMEPPAAFSATALRNEKTKILQVVRKLPPEEILNHVVRGQYEGYLEQQGVQRKSQTPTYAALRLYLDNWRWQGVPFFLRSGKRMQEKTTEIIIQFKCPPHIMFPLPDGYRIRSNYLALCIQPDEGIHLRFEAKEPDKTVEMRSVDMEFHYADTFGESAIPDAYERLILDALNGDASLFTRSDEIELGWGIIDPICEACEQPDALPITSYTPGSWGPDEADQLLRGSHLVWLRGCGKHRTQSEYNPCDPTS